MATKNIPIKYIFPSKIVYQIYQLYHLRNKNSISVYKINYMGEDDYLEIVDSAAVAMFIISDSYKGWQDMGNYYKIYFNHLGNLHYVRFPWL